MKNNVGSVRGVGVGAGADYLRKLLEGIRLAHRLGRGESEGVSWKQTQMLFRCMHKNVGR